MMHSTHELAAAALSHAHPAKPKLHEMHIRPVSGGFIVKHLHKHADGSHAGTKHHVIHDMDALHEHLEQHMGEPNPGEEEAESAAMEHAEQKASPGGY